MSTVWTPVRRFAFLCLALILASGLAFANVFDRDDRVPVEIQPGNPLARVGRLTKSNGERGTAFLVGACYVMTNYHATFLDQSHPQENEVLIFEMAGEAPVNAHPVVHGQVPTSGFVARDQDWSLLRLDTCLGQTYGWFRLASFALRQISQAPLQMVGYPQDRELDHAWMDPSCRLLSKTAPNENDWKHDCAARPGSSGSPLLLKQGDDYVVVAIHSQGHGDFPEVMLGVDEFSANSAVPIAKTLEAVLKVLPDAQAKGPFGLRRGAQPAFLEVD